MNRAFILAAALSFALPSMAMAQAEQQEKPGAGPPPRPGGNVGHPAPAARPPAGPQPSHLQEPRPQEGHPQQPRPQEGHPQQPRPQEGHPQPSRPQEGHPQPPRPQPGRQEAGRPMPTYARPLPPRGNQFWHRGQYYNRIHGPAYAYPPGFGYRQWAIGARIPPALVVPGYYYGDWSGLGLQAPPPGYSWVRYGPDLLLVNLTTDEVEDVIYGVFQ